MRVVLNTQLAAAVHNYKALHIALLPTMVMLADCQSHVSLNICHENKHWTDLASHGHLSKVVIAQQLTLLLLEGKDLLYERGVVLLPAGGPRDVGPVHLLTQRSAHTTSIRVDPSPLQFPMPHAASQE